MGIKIKYRKTFIFNYIYKGFFDAWLNPLVGLVLGVNISEKSTFCHYFNA